MLPWMGTPPTAMNTSLSQMKATRTLPICREPLSSPAPSYGQLTALGWDTHWEVHASSPPTNLGKSPSRT